MLDHDAALVADLERDPLTAVLAAVADLSEGDPVDVDRLRALVTAAADQAEAHATDPAAGARLAASAWADRYRRLLAAVDAIEAGELEAALTATRSAMYRQDPA